MLVVLLALLIGSSGGGLVASLLQRRILHIPFSESRRWTIVTIAAWCCAVAAILALGLPFALMLAQIFRPLGMNGIGVLGGCVGGGIAWLQLRTLSVVSVSRCVWIVLFATVWAVGLLIVLYNPSALF